MIAKQLCYSWRDLLPVATLALVPVSVPSREDKEKQSAASRKAAVVAFLHGVVARGHLVSKKLSNARCMMAWSLGSVFSQESSFRNGAVEQSNFHDYAPTLTAEDALTRFICF
jgi:hypothetical protein